VPFCTYNNKLQIDRQIHIFAQEATNKMAKTKATARKCNGCRLPSEHLLRRAEDARPLDVDCGRIYPEWAGFTFTTNRYEINSVKRHRKDCSVNENIRFKRRFKAKYTRQSIHDLMEMKKLSNEEWNTFEDWAVGYVACNEMLAEVFEDINLARKMERLEIDL
jgi:hypothetical protein